MRTLSLVDLAAEAGAPVDLLGWLVELGQLRPLEDGRLGEVVVEEGVVVALPRGTASFTPIGRIELKGFPMPVALWRASAP